MNNRSYTESMNRQANYFPEFALLILILAAYAAQSLYFGAQLINYATEGHSRFQAMFIPWLDKAFASGSLKTFLDTLQNIHNPPLYSLCAYALAMLFGKSWMLMTLVLNAVFLVILLVFTYLLAFEIKGRQTAIFSAVITALLPPIYGTYTLYSMDFAITAMAASSIYCLYRSKYFNDLKWSLLFAVSCGIGMLIKETYAGYLIGPVLYALYLAFLRVYKSDYAALKNILVFLALTLIIVSPYYLGEKSMMWVLSAPFREPAAVPWYSFVNIRLITVGICESLLSPPIFTLFVIGAFFFFSTRFQNNTKWLLALWIIVPSIAIILSPHWKTARYLMPALPAYAIVAAIGIREITSSKAGRLAVAVLLAVAMLQYIPLLFGRGLTQITGRAKSLPKYIRYYSYFDSFRPFNDRLRIGRIQADTHDPYSRAMRLSAGSKVNVFMPYFSSDFDIYPSYFWFQKMEVWQYQFTDDTSLTAVRANRLPYDPEVQYDFVSFYVENKDLNKVNYLDMPFKSIKEQLFFWFGDDYFTEKELAVHETIWKKLISTMPVRKIAYSTKDGVVYLYARQ